MYADSYSNSNKQPVYSRGNPRGRQDTLPHHLWRRHECGTPSLLLFGSSHNFVISDSLSHSIRVFSPEGNLLHTIESEGHQQGMFYKPRGVAVVPNGRLVCVFRNENYGLRIFLFCLLYIFLINQIAYRIASNMGRGKEDNFTPNREIIIYICTDLSISETCGVENHAKLRHLVKKTGL